MQNRSFMGALLCAGLALGIGGCGSTSSSGGGGGAGATDGGGGQGGAPTEIHGCTFDTAMDMTGMASVNVTDISEWVVPHNACVRVSTGTVVVWDGNFSVHPLVGGISPNADDSSPISQAEADTGIGSAEVTLADEGTYPYFCEVHLNTMIGVIYVVP